MVGQNRVCGIITGERYISCYSVLTPQRQEMYVKQIQLQVNVEAVIDDCLESLQQCQQDHVSQCTTYSRKYMFNKGTV